ncbi:MAG: hypothetical protein KGI75_00935 [Rhizobiaceae bacterium]|nr:hypothetical protein [Rhizobiaceae bacterium]
MSESSKNEAPKSAEKPTSAMPSRERFARRLASDGIVVAASDVLHAEADESGIVIVRAATASAVAGHLGLAVAMNGAESLAAGNRGTIVALNDVRRVALGDDGLAVVRKGFVEGAVLDLAPGAVAIFMDNAVDEDRFSYRIAVAEADRTLTHLDYVGSIVVMTQPVGTFGWDEEEEDGQPFDGQPAEEIVGIDTPAAFDPREDRTVLRAAGNARGLMMCRGDAVAAGLKEEDYWELLRVSDAEVDGDVPLGAVGISGGEHLFSAFRANMLTFLSDHGLDCSGIAGAGLTVGGNDAVVFASELGDVALAGRGGWACCGCGTAEVGDTGIAVADEGGLASAGHGGIAFSTGKRNGKALSGDHGLAVALGRNKHVASGSGSAAYALGHAEIDAGSDSIAIGDSANIRVGMGSVAVTETGCVSGKEGSLLVAIDRSSGITRIAAGVVGIDGLQPGEPYRFWQGRLERASLVASAFDGVGHRP